MTDIDITDLKNRMNLEMKLLSQEKWNTKFYFDREKNALEFENRFPKKDKFIFPMGSIRELAKEDKIDISINFTKRRLTINNSIRGKSVISLGLRRAPTAPTTIEIGGYEQLNGLVETLNLKNIEIDESICKADYNIKIWGKKYNLPKCALEKSNITFIGPESKRSNKFKECIKEQRFKSVK